jgi:hypothetical protein
MNKNVGKADRVIRTLIAIVIAILYFTGAVSGILAIILSMLALVFLITSFTGSCPIYSAIGTSTLKKREP